MASTRPIGVLASGTGSILHALIEAELPIAVIATDRSCKAEEIGRAAGIEVVRVERTDFSSGFDRDRYTEQLIEALDPFKVVLIAMAGFGTVLGQAAHAAYPGKILNTHPALLPQFKGWHAVADALQAGVKVTGCTVHLATLEVDAGPILAQKEVPILAGDTIETLHDRIKQVERKLYPETILAFAESLSSDLNVDQTRRDGLPSHCGQQLMNGLDETRNFTDNKQGGTR